MKTQNPLRVGVLFGGRSSEHEVSLNSARNVISALEEAGHQVVPVGISRSGQWLISGEPMHFLSHEKADSSAKLTPPGGWSLIPQGNEANRLGQVDILFPVLHGPYGEDGTVQGLMEMANIPYVGCGVLASAVGMDKGIFKQLMDGAGIPQTPYRLILRREWQQHPQTVLGDLEEALPYPLFVKPANLGSSIGISRADDRTELTAALELAAQYDRRLIVEQAVPHAREIEVSVLGNEDPRASVPGEIVPGNQFYDYAAKYLDDNSQLVIPAPLSPELTRQMQQIAVQAFKLIDGSGLARVDFLVNRQTEAVYLNELNTLPGFTRISMYPKLWAASGVSYPELMDQLLQLALQRFANKP